MRVQAYGRKVDERLIYNRGVSRVVQYGEAHNPYPHFRESHRQLQQNCKPEYDQQSL